MGSGVEHLNSINDLLAKPTRHKFCKTFRSNRERHLALFGVRDSQKLHSLHTQTVGHSKLFRCFSVACVLQNTAGFLNVRQHSSPRMGSRLNTFVVEAVV